MAEVALLNGADPAEPAAAPSSSAATAPSEVGSAPLSLDELRSIPKDQRTPRQKRRLAALEKQAAADKRKAQRDAKAAAKAAEPPAEPGAAVEPADEDRDDAQRERETGGAWRLTLRIVSLVLWPFGWELDRIGPKEVAEDVTLLLPLVRRHRWLDLTVRYAALPYLLIERVVGLAKRRKPPEPAKATP